MSGHRYLHSVEQDDVELGRLTLQAGIIDPVTIRRLEAIGTVNGWKCLEVGAGAGSIAQWLSTRVGPAGRVVATDIDLRFLRRLSASNLEIRQHNILGDELEKAAYDLVHCRCLLMHLPEPEKALRKMADAVRAGGWLIIEEQDYGSMASADIVDPSAAPFASTIRAMNDFLLKKGMMNQYFGRQVHRLVEQLGFVEVGQDGWTRMIRGGEPYSRWAAVSLQAGTRPMVDAGLLTREDCDSIVRLLLDDPTFNYPGPILFCAWGRKPVEEGD